MKVDRRTKRGEGEPGDARDIRCVCLLLLLLLRGWGGVGAASEGKRLAAHSLRLVLVGDQRSRPRPAR